MSFVNFYKNIFTDPFSKLFQYWVKNIFVGFVSALFGDNWNSSSDKTSAKEQVKFTQFLIFSFFFLISYFHLLYLDMLFLNTVSRSSHQKCSLKEVL